MKSIRRLTAALDDPQDPGTAGTRTGQRPQHQRAAEDGGSLRVDNADSRLNRIRLSGLTEASVPTTSAASHSPRRIASTPSCMAVPPEAQAVEVAIGEPLVPKRTARFSPTEANRNRSNHGS